MLDYEIMAVRLGLGYSQAAFASLLGVCPMTVSKWERGIASPNGFQAGLLRIFFNAIGVNKGIHAEVKEMGADYYRALRLLLDTGLG